MKENGKNQMNPVKSVTEYQTTFSADGEVSGRKQIRKEFEYENSGSDDLLWHMWLSTLGGVMIAMGALLLAQRIF